jgi:hypothetical protein
MSRKGALARSIVLLAAAASLASSAYEEREERPAAPGGRRLLALSGETLAVETVYEDDFSRETGDWLVEGNAKVAVRDGRLHFDASGARRSAATIWLKRSFAGDAVIEYTARVEEGPGATNINFFVYGSNLDGSSVLETSRARTGSYSEYHRLRNYIYTFLNEVPEEDGKPKPPERLRVRFRKDPGFHLLKEAWRDPIEKGRDYQFTIVIQGPRMRFYVGGELVFDHRDEDSPHRKGEHAFRTFESHVSADVFRVSRIAER